MPKASQIDHNDVLNRYRAGTPIYALMTHYRTSYPTIRAILNAHGVSVRRGHLGRPQGDIEAAVTAYLAGSTLDEAARIGRVGFNPLRRVLRDRKLLRRTGETRQLRELLRSRVP